jgi:hypothetical protein
MAKGGRREHSGRKRKATALKIVQGTFRDDRHGAEPRGVALAWPDPPQHLTERERALWADLGRVCGPWVAPGDWMAVNGAVSLMGRILAIQDAMRETPDAGRPLTVTFTPSADGEPNPEPAVNPLYGAELKFWTALRGYLAILGLSPADRTRMPAAPDAMNENPLDRFIKRGAR